MADFYVHVGLEGNEGFSWLSVLGGELEGLGFKGVFLADSLGSPYEPLIPLTALAANTSRLLVGTCVYVLALRSPLFVAKQVSDIQRLSGGRFVLGVGVGWRRWEFEALGVDYGRRGAITDEAISVLRLAWRGDPVSFRGSHFRFEGVSVGAGLGATPQPPIWVGGNSRSAMRRAARLGDAWIPTDLSPEEYEEAIPIFREELRRHGRVEGEVGLCSHLALVLDRDRSRARALAAQAASRFGERLEEFERYALVGDPSEVAEKLGRYISLGVGHHVLSTFLTESRDTLMEKLRLFSSEVAPSL